MGLIGGIYSGINYTHRTLDTDAHIQDIDDLLDTFISAGKKDEIVSIFQMPTIFYPNEQTTETVKEPIKYTKTISRPSTLDNGYTPRNKKLLTYPYNFVLCDTCNDTHTYRFEWSNKVDAYENVALKFEYSCGLTPNPEIIVAPLDYNTVLTNDSPNMSETVMCNGFPQCAFAIDAFRAYLAQNASKLVGGVASGVAGALTGGVGAVVGAVGIGGMISGGVDALTRGSAVKGSQGTSSEVAIKKKGIYWKCMSVQENYARMIDDYFDRYGYSCCEIGVPNRNVRQHWTYTKTQDCAITGNVPVDALKKLKSIYNNGITFWVSGDDVGNYNQVNEVITT